MKRSMLAAAISVALTGGTASAAQHGAQGPKPVTHGASSAHAVPAAHGHPSSAPAQGRGHASPKPGGAHAGKTTTPAGTKTHTTAKTSTKTNTPAGTVAMTPVQQKLQTNTNLARKLQSRLPAGADLMTSAAGFRNLGQFVAAVNVSKNLGISFTDLKTRMVDRNMSLGQAIQDLRPGTDGTTAQRAQSEADELIRSTAQTPATSSMSTSKKTVKHGGQ